MIFVLLLVFLISQTCLLKKHTTKKNIKKNKKQNKNKEVWEAYLIFYDYTTTC